MHAGRRQRWLFSLSNILMVFILISGIASPTQKASASHTANPASVTIASDLQSELGCPGDWQPGCATTHLTYDAVDDVWQGTFNIPAGSWQYKAALNDNWSQPAVTLSPFLMMPHPISRV